MEHYRPVRLFSELRREYSNLFYACQRCNSRKKDFWPAKSQEKTHFLPNPCDHVMHEHLRYDGATAVSRSPAGEVAVSLLDLNQEIYVSWRTIHIRKVQKLRAELRVLEGDLSTLDREIRRATDPQRLAALQGGRTQLEQQRTDIHNELEWLAETP